MTRKWLLVVGLVLTSILGACGEWTADYTGEGNRFTVEMSIVEVGSQSVRGEILRIDEANGRADGWFKIDNTHRIHDNCDCHGFWRSRKKYGRVFDNSGQEITLDDLTGNECLRLEGRIRSNSEGKTWDDRPVFDNATVQPCG